VLVGPGRGAVQAGIRSSEVLRSACEFVPRALRSRRCRPRADSEAVGRAGLFSSGGNCHPANRSAPTRRTHRIKRTPPHRMGSIPGSFSSRPCVYLAPARVLGSPVTTRNNQPSLGVYAPAKHLYPLGCIPCTGVSLLGVFNDQNTPGTVCQASRKGVNRESSLGCLTL